MSYKISIKQLELASKNQTNFKKLIKIYSETPWLVFKLENAAMIRNKSSSIED